ncbi:MAG: TlyA family rRNA (cytidine-2'-O)-methyltransferase, partial [Zetaproteobacteria bacterium]|nr:TlyA family rRNA (cytidine-2'-O)-methyltransferase [Pseudobdellovibrionaceae bacterium]
MLKNRKHLSKKKIRADQHVLAMGLADSISQAKALIMAGKVISGDQRVEKPGDMIFAEAEVRLKTDDSHYVSRGGEKLAGAIKYFALLDFIQGRTVLDVGASTGGFTHCCLEHGAKKVYSVDVGTNQLAWEMRKDPRVVAIERT